MRLITNGSIARVITAVSTAYGAVLRSAITDEPLTRQSSSTGSTLKNSRTSMRNSVSMVDYQGEGGGRRILLFLLGFFLGITLLMFIGCETNNTQKTHPSDWGPYGYSAVETDQ